MRTWSLLALALAGLVQTNASDETMLRRLMVDHRFISIISPCKTGGTNRQNAAEWLRTGFHDSADHDAAAGTGGIDSSIQYETDYSENSGVGFTSVMTQYKFYRQQSVSMADIIALGAIVAVGSCGGPMVPFYYGRTDASAAHPPGYTPDPADSAATHKETFARMGFSETEMIQLVACGHTIGGVKAANHPELTSTVNAPFDETIANFDNNVAVGYMNDTRINPMAQPYDPSSPGTSSDARVFAIDGNATISSMAASNDAFNNQCNTALSKLFNNAVPSSVTLKGPIVPFPVSGTLRMALRNEVYTVSIGSFRLYDMVGQWSSFTIGYTERSGAIGTAGIVSAKTSNTYSIGKTVEVKTMTTGITIPASTGIGSIFATVTLNDGTVYSSAEGEESITMDDTIILDYGNKFTCVYTGTANDNGTGLNVTAAVLAPYDTSDKVDLLLRTYAGEVTTIRMSYRSSREDGTYNYYGAFVADTVGLNTYAIGVKLTRADGSVHVDTRDDVYWTLNTFSKCVAGADVPTPAPIPSGSITRRNTVHKRVAQNACPSGYSSCGGRCVNTASDLEHCGGCAGYGGVDCTTLSDGAISCIAGKCVAHEEE